MITAFEDFVNAELPRRPVMLTLANTSYSGDPNLSVAPIINNAPIGSFFINDADDTLWQKKEALSTSWIEVGSGSGGFTHTVIDNDDIVTVPEGQSMLFAEDVTILDGDLVIEGDITPVKDAENFTPKYIPATATRVVPENDVVYYDPDDLVVDGNFVVDGDALPFPVSDGNDVLSKLTDIAPTTSIVGTQASVTSHLTPTEARTAMDVLSTSEVATAALAAVPRFSALSEEDVITGPHAAEAGKLYRYQGSVTFTLPASPAQEDTIGFWSANSANILTLDGNGNGVRTADNYSQSIKTIYLNQGIGYAVFRNSTWYFISDGISAWFSEQLPYMMLGTDSSGLPVTTKFGDPYLALSETAVSTATTVVGEQYATVRFLVNSASARTLQLPSGPNEGDRAGFQHWGVATNQVIITLDGNGENIESLYNPLTTAASFTTALQGSFYVACRYNGGNWVIESQSGAFDAYVYGDALAANAVGHTDGGGLLTRTSFSGANEVLGEVEGGGLTALQPYNVNHIAGDLAAVADTAVGTQNSWTPGGVDQTFERANIINWAGASDITINGIHAAPSSADFVPIKVIRNNQSSSTVRLIVNNESGSAVAGERIRTPRFSSFYLGEGEAVVFSYDFTDSRWTLVSQIGTSELHEAPNSLLISLANGFVTNLTIPDFHLVGRLGSGTSIDFLNPAEIDYTLRSALSSTTVSVAVSGTQNDYAPSSAAAWRASWRAILLPSADTTITGFDVDITGSNLVIQKVLVNDGTFDLNLTHEDAGSTAANRISTPDGQPYVIPPGHSVGLWYNQSQARWRLMTDSQARPTQTARALGVNELLDATVTTTDATVTTIHTFSTVADNTTARFKFQVQALETATGDAALFDVAALSYRDGSSVVTIKDLAFLNGPFRDQGAWDVTFNVSSQDIQVQVTGEAAKTIKWRINGHVQED